MITRALNMHTLGKTSVPAEYAGAVSYSFDLVKSGELPYGIPCGLDTQTRQIKMLPSVHMAGIGSTGSGKSMSLAAPSICAAGSTRDHPTILVFDVKGDLFNQTAAYVSSCGYLVHHLRMDGGPTDLFNPLYHPWALCRAGQSDAAEEIVRHLYESLFDRVRSNHDPFWAQKGTQNMTLATLVLLQNSYDENSVPTIATAVDLACGPMDTLKIKAELCSKEMRKRVDSMFESSGPCSSDHIAHIQATCAFFTGGLGASLTGESTFQYDDVFAEDTPRAFYFSLPESASKEMKAFFSMIMDGFLGHYVSHKSQHPDSRAMVAILDEFSSYPKSMTGGVMDLLSTARSRGLYINLFLQSSEQLLSSSKYDAHEAKTALSQCRTLFMFNSAAEMEQKILIGRGGISEENAQSLNYLRAGECQILNNLENYRAQRVQLPPLSAYQSAGLFVTESPLPDIGARVSKSKNLLGKKLTKHRKKSGTAIKVDASAKDAEQAKTTWDSESRDLADSIRNHQIQTISEYESVRKPANPSGTSEKGTPKRSAGICHNTHEKWSSKQSIKTAIQGVLAEAKEGNDEALNVIRGVCSGAEPSFDMCLYAEYEAIGIGLSELCSDQEAVLFEHVFHRSLSNLITLLQLGLYQEVLKMDQYGTPITRDFININRALSKIYTSTLTNAHDLAIHFNNSHQAEYLGFWAAHIVADYCVDPDPKRSKGLMMRLARSFEWYRNGAVYQIYSAMSTGASYRDLPPYLQALLK